jgi:hypothetical protein
MDNYKKRSFRRLNKNCKKSHCPALLQFSSSRIRSNIHLGKDAAEYPGAISAPFFHSARCLLSNQTQTLRPSRSGPVAFLKPRSDLVQRPVAPFLGFGEQLPAVFGMKCCALTAEGFHRAAVNELFHRHLPDSVGDIVSPALSRCHYDYATE